MKTWITLAALILLAAAAYRFAPQAHAVDGEEPLCVVTHVDVIPPHAAAGRDLLRQFVIDTRRDPGSIRVEVFEELGRPNHSTVVEIWKDRKAYDDHLAADHTRAYRGKLQPMLGSPFDERLHRLSK